MTARRVQSPVSLSEVEWEGLNRELTELTSRIWSRLPAELQFTAEWVGLQQQALAAFGRLRPRPFTIVRAAADRSWTPSFPGESNPLSHGS